MSEDFHRIKRLPPYVFAEVNRLKAAARARGADIVDLGMGNPDMPTPQHIVDKLIETARDPKAGRYSASKGIPGLSVDPGNASENEIALAVSRYQLFVAGNEYWLIDQLNTIMRVGGVDYAKDIRSVL